MSSNFIFISRIAVAIRDILGGAYNTTPRQGVELRNDNKTAVLNSYTLGATSANPMVMGKDYFYELTIDEWAASAAPCLGFVRTNDTPGLEAASAYYYYASLSAIRRGLNTTVATVLGTVKPGDVIGIRLDLRDGGRPLAYFFRNGISIAANITIPVGDYYALACAGNINHTATISANFGEAPFRYPIEM